MASTAQSLVTGSNCLDCIPPAQRWPVLLYLLAQIAKMSASATQLVSSAQCLDCIPPAQQMPVALYLLSQISAGAGSGTGYGTVAQRNAFVPSSYGFIWTVSNSSPPNQLSSWTPGGWTATT